MDIRLLWLVPVLPLLGCVVNALVGARLGRRFSTLAGVGSVWLAFLVAAYFVATYALGGLAPAPVETFAPWNWFDAGALQVRLGLLLDPLSLVMILIVTGVGALIHTYSAGYMAEDPGFNRYFCYLNLFTFSMLVLVLGNSFLMLFVGWEGVGLCSYLLIGFWFGRQSATDAGKKAFIVNRIGDWAFVIGMILTFVVFLPKVGVADGLRFQTIFPYFAKAWHENQGLPPELGLVPTIAALLFIGATGKSAQLPVLYVWLPDAMEGPTPVSALIHAATMVTAGVYMVARCHLFYVASPDVMHAIAWVGVATAFLAATIACVQTDIKRVLAYSTISQIGYMFIGAGVGAFSYSIFHLLTHAFFKALLFLGAGAVIHALHNEQDMRKMGGLHRQIPVVSWMMAAGVAAISGLPLTSGFFSKDLILGKAAEYSVLLWIVGTLTAFLTAYYMCRLWFMTFWAEDHWRDVRAHEGASLQAHGSGSALDAPDVQPEPPVGDGQASDADVARQGSHGGGGELHPPPMNMLAPMAVLAFLSLVGGALYTALPHFLDPVFADAGAGLEGRPFLPELALYSIAALVFLGGLALAWAAYGRSNVEPKPWMTRRRDTYRFLANAWWIDTALHRIFAGGGERAARTTYNELEQKVIDRGAVDGTAGAVRWVSRHLRHAQTGVVGDYALAMAFGATCVIVYFLMR